MNRPRNPKITWVVVADASRARIFHLQGRTTWVVIDELEHPAGREHVNARVSDRQGRVVQHGDSSQRSALEPHTSPHDAESIRFAHVIAERIERGRTRGLFEDLVLVAPPQFLGRLRAALGREGGKRVRATLAKDLSQLEPQDLRDRVVEAVHSSTAS